MQIKPGINADGFRTAVKDYTESTVVEELGANSYDADSSSFLVLLDNKNFGLYIIDDGIGFDEEIFAGLATLGSGSKKVIPYSKGKRHYLGSYGYGVKSTLNICDSLEITSFSGGKRLSATIDWSSLDEFLKDSSKGFKSTVGKIKNGARGTFMHLKLKNPTDKTHLDNFFKALTNLPEDQGRFVPYVGFYEDVAGEIPRDLSNFTTNLKKLCKRWVRSNKIRKVDSGQLIDLANCKVEEKRSKEDDTVSAKFFFSGFEGNGVKKLKPGLRGIYLRIHGRLLKQSFTDRKYTYNISKWTKFESGLRVELEIDWLRDQITLSREGIRFSNEKLENDFRKILQSSVASFIQPHLKRLNQKKKRLADKKSIQRLELAKKRIDRKRDSLVPGLKSGFIYKPESDAELALVLSQPLIMKKVLRNHILVDYNDQAPFDCLLYNEKDRSFVNCELEPKLISFLEHNDATDVDLIVTWTIVGWKVGAKKKGKPGHLELKKSDGLNVGEYKLLEYASEKSKKPRKDYRVLVLEEIIKP